MPITAPRQPQNPFKLHQAVTWTLETTNLSWAPRHRLQPTRFNNPEQARHWITWQNIFFKQTARSEVCFLRGRKKSNSYTLNSTWVLFQSNILSHQYKAENIQFVKWDRDFSLSSILHKHNQVLWPETPSAGRPGSFDDAHAEALLLAEL